MCKTSPGKRSWSTPMQFWTFKQHKVFNPIWCYLYVRTDSNIMHYKHQKIFEPSSKKLNFHEQIQKFFFLSPKWKVLVEGKIDAARSASASPARRIGTIYRNTIQIRINKIECANFVEKFLERNTNHDWLHLTDGFHNSSSHRWLDLPCYCRLQKEGGEQITWMIIISNPNKIDFKFLFTMHWSLISYVP